MLLIGITHLDKSFPSHGGSKFPPTSLVGIDSLANILPHCQKELDARTPRFHSFDSAHGVYPDEVGVTLARHLSGGIFWILTNAAPTTKQLAGLPVGTPFQKLVAHAYTSVPTAQCQDPSSQPKAQIVVSPPSEKGKREEAEKAVQCTTADILRTHSTEKGKGV